MSKQAKLVIVDWVDSCRKTEWHCPVGESPAGLKERLLACRSVGWLSGESKEAIVVTPHVSFLEGNDKAATGSVGDMIIPRRAVVKIRRIKE